MKTLDTIHVSVDNTLGQGSATLSSSSVYNWEVRYQLVLNLGCGPCIEFMDVHGEGLLNVIQRAIDRCSTPESALYRYLLLLVGEKARAQLSAGGGLQYELRPSGLWKCWYPEDTSTYGLGNSQAEAKKDLYRSKA